MANMKERLKGLKTKTIKNGMKTLALLTGMCALSSCGSLGISTKDFSGFFNGFNGFPGYYGGFPMYQGNMRPGMSGFAPGDTYLGVNGAGQHVIRAGQPMLSTKNQEFVTRKDADGIAWEVAMGTQLPKDFRVVTTDEGRTIPVPADQYNNVTAALKKGELNFVVDANGEYGLVPQAAANEVRTGTLTFKDLAKMARNQNTTKPSSKGKDR